MPGHPESAHLCGMSIVVRSTYYFLNFVWLFVQMATFLDLPTEIIVQITDPAYIGQSTQYTAARTCKHLAHIIAVSPDNICDLAAIDGNISILQWAIALGEIPTTKTTASAAKSGCLQTLEYLRSIQCPWDAAVYAKAAANGHNHIIQYARDNGLPFDVLYCAKAAKHGQLAVIEYLLSMVNYRTIIIIKYQRIAAKYGQIPVLQLLHKIGNISSDCAYYTVKYAQYDVIEWLEQINIPCSHWYASSAAAKYGRIDVLDWLESRVQYQPSCTLWNIAIYAGQINVMDWLHARRVPTYYVEWPSVPCLPREWAITNGYLQG